MAELGNTLDGFRELYMESYREAIVEYRETHKPSASEVLLEIGGRDEMPLVFRLYRMDLASRVNDSSNFTDVNLDDLPKQEPRTFVVGGVNVELAPIAWNGVIFVGPEFDPEAPELLSWATEWIDVNEENTEDAFGLGGYVHSVSYPELTKSGHMTFSVDFGSAESEAFLELVDVFSKLGISNIEVHSRWLSGGT